MDRPPTDISYPPLFPTTRSHHHHKSTTTQSPSLQPQSQSQSQPEPEPGPTLHVPLLDLHHLDPHLLSQSCQTLGLFRLTNHGLPPGISDRLFALAREILSRSFQSKVADLAEGPVKYFWGTPAVTLSLKELNWLEGLHVSPGKLASAADVAEFGDFRNLAIEYCEHMVRISRTLFNTMASELNLDREQRVAYLSESDGIFWIYRYPICPDSFSYLGMEAHTDSSVLTILNEDDVGGLQAFHENAWLDVVPVPGTLIVNLGDLMQVVSDDRYKSVKHRVLASGVAERLSLGYFVFPEEEIQLCSSSYRQFTLKEYRAQVLEDIVKTKSKIGLKQFKKEKPDSSQ